METKSESEKKKDEQVEKNEVANDTLARDEEFWHSTLKNLSKELISEKKLGETNANTSSLKHPAKVFSIYCKCSKCLIYRKLIVGIYFEGKAYNDLWNKLKQIISSYYTMLPPDQEAVMSRKYKELQTESCGIRWLSDGNIDVDKNVHVSMGNYFSLSNEMTFIIMFNMLILRDRHQLFEHLFLQLSSIVLAYREGIKEMTKYEHDEDEHYKPVEFLNYVFDGYDKMTEIADTLTPLVIEMRDHLQNFSLTWQLLNQCMYYRFLYIDIESHMADCILRLKDAVDTETYKSYVYRFIKLDEEMTQIGQVWEVALVALELYRKSIPEQVARDERTDIIKLVFKSLTKLKKLPEVVDESEQSLTIEWTTLSEQDDFWLKILSVIKKETLYVENLRRNCQCWACAISDGNTPPDIWAAPKLALSKSDGGKADQCYHLAWAVFKHLKDRQIYTKHLFRPDNFCVFKDPPCQQTECQVAANLVIGSYPLSFTKFLLRTYQPLAVNDREKFLKVPSQSLIRKFCLKKGGAAAKEIMQEAEEINHSFLLLNMFWDDDDIADSMLRAGLAAALAENFKIEVNFPSRHVIFSYFYALFRISSGDIQMDLEWLEKINLANLFKSFGVISNTIDETAALTSNSVEAIEMTLNELNITAEVSTGSNNTLDLVQFSMKEVADKLSSISLTDDGNENAKKVLENEIKKPLVEALKLAASNKKLEAELKSLQKEHNMLKDMVKGLEQIHGEKKELQVTVTTASAPKASTTDNQISKCGHGHAAHNHSQSGSTSPSMSDIDHGKDSGNGNDCVCYYCTLFGKNQDLMSSRSTETRDRLRKRLHHLQSQKDFSSKSKNLKNISLLLKNGAAAAAAASSQKVSSSKCSETTAHKCSNGNLPTGTSLKMKVELELQQRKKKVNSPKPNHTSKPEEVKIQRATEINLKSLENLVEYIEGPSSKAVVEQKKAEEAAAKKQLKKAKQMELKVRRQIDSQLEVLNKLNSQIQEVVIDVKQVQNQLSQLKAGKGKNKELKKVRTAEEKLAQLKSHRTKLENNVKAIFCDIKELNPCLDLHHECYEMKTVSAMLPPQTVTKTSEKTQMKSQTPPVNQPLSLPAQARGHQQHLEQTTKLLTAPLSTTRLEQQQSQQQQKSAEEDSAKRMVTIRRINLPHAEPQVTVTAKGTTPDMDQLLYTFVNGQLVPASSLSPSAFQNGSIQLFMSSNGQTKMVVENQLRKQMTKNEAPNPQQQKQQTTEKNKKKTANVENVTDKPKKKNEKKKEESEPAISKKETEKQENSKKLKTATKPDLTKAKVNNMKKKGKKAYIDPEFAANPFKLLDDDEEHSDSDDDKSDVVEKVIKPVKKVEEEPKVNGKKSKEDKKSAKKQSNTQPLQSVKSEKNNQKANQLKKNDRKDSITSTASSNASRDSKSRQKILNNVRNQAPVPSKAQPAQMMSSNSIMDQLNRGVRVEGLRLPPGITLTKVAPSDALGMKRESINRIAQPMQDFVEPRRPINDPIVSMGDQNGIIMVESNPRAYHTQNAQQTQQEVVGGKKKNKKKKQKAESAENQPQMSDTKHQQSAERMVTLKNPMFYNNPSEPMSTMMRNLQTPPFVSPMAEPPAASIIRNENGMYTIRNPTFQNAFAAPSPSNTNTSRQPVEPVARQFAPNKFTSFEGDGQPTDDSQPKCSSVIGSEMKNVLQRRKEQEFAANIDPYHQFGMRNQSSYSHFGGSGVNFNNNGTNCDDSYASNSLANAFQSFPHSMAGNYEDLRLQPGQMLNSEVTIHNVTESKMFMNQAKKTPPPPIGTPRNGNMDGVVSMFGDLLISRPSELLNGNETSIFASKQNEKIADLENDRRFDFNNAPPKQQMKIGNESAKKAAISHRMSDEFDKIQQNSTNSNSPISITSLDEIFECADDQKNGNGSKKSSFYPTLQKFNDKKPQSGASSLFSSAI